MIKGAPSALLYTAAINPSSPLLGNDDLPAFVVSAVSADMMRKLCDTALWAQGAGGGCQLAVRATASMGDRPTGLSLRDCHRLDPFACLSYSLRSCVRQPTRRARKLTAPPTVHWTVGSFNCLLYSLHSCVRRLTRRARKLAAPPTIHWTVGSFVIATRT